jgi:hypothetical protein
MDEEVAEERFELQGIGCAVSGVGGGGAGGVGSMVVALLNSIPRGEECPNPNVPSPLPLISTVGEAVEDWKRPSPNKPRPKPPVLARLIFTDGLEFRGPAEESGSPQPLPVPLVKGDEGTGEGGDVEG